MQEPLPPRVGSLLSDSSSPNHSTGPPRTPEKQSRTDSSASEEGSDGSSHNLEPSSYNATNQSSPTKINTLPAISSPLANSTTVRHAAARVRSPLHRRRNTKGPSTPLARFVSHKIVAEKLASARKAKPTPPSDNEGTASNGVPQPTAQNVPPRAPRSTTLTAPTSSSALKSTTKANERMISSQVVAARSTMKRGPSPINSAQPSVQPTTQGKRNQTRDAPPTIKTARRLEIGQAAGIGPRNAAQTLPWR